MDVPTENAPQVNTANFQDLNVENLNINTTKENFMNDCTIARESTVTDMGIAAIDAAEQAGYASSATAERIGLGAEATAQRGFNHADGTAQRMAIAELDAIGRVGGDVCDSSRDIMRDIHSADNHLAGAVERLGLFNAGVTERQADKIQAEVERFGLSELAAINASERYLFAGMSANAKDILLKSCADTASIKDQSASQFKDLLLQNAENAKDAAITACTNFKDLIILGDKHYAAIQIEALRNKEDLARQMAECCCEQKALTLETSHATQDLVRKWDEQRVRDELAKARDELAKSREELIALRLRATLSPAPVAAIAV